MGARSEDIWRGMVWHTTRDHSLQVLLYVLREWLSHVLVEFTHSKSTVWLAFYDKLYILLYETSHAIIMESMIDSGRSHGAGHVHAYHLHKLSRSTCLYQSLSGLYAQFAFLKFGLVSQVFRVDLLRGEYDNLGDYEEGTKCECIYLYRPRLAWSDIYSSRCPTPHSLRSDLFMHARLHPCISVPARRKR